ncbi:MAG: hypothetical protein HWE14_02750 [Flavobacteriia bacterium]|nr:hypothetical protein [Flavobacteriia bacterium]
MTDTFLLEEVPVALRRLNEDVEPQWGEMNATEMVDHLYHALLLGQNREDWPLRQPVENLPALKEFLMGPKPFPRSAEKPAGFIETEVEPSPNLEAAVERFLNEVPSLMRAVSQPNYRMVHPDFGVLNGEEALMLNRKHIRHHLAQFGLMER